MDVIVSDHYGLNLDTDALHFGRVKTPGGADRAIIISNTYEKPVKVLISTRGEIRDWVFINESRFILNPDEVRNVTFSLNVPENIAQGNHTGTVKIIFERVLI